MTMRFLILVMAGVTLSGCGIAAKIDARNEMMDSKRDYTNCLTAHPDDTKACEGYRLAYQADMQAYRATSAGIMRGRNDTVNVNVDNGQ
jgi:hypothetical protein